MATATAMYHTERNPLRKISRNSEEVSITRKGRQRRLHKAFLRYHDPDNWPLLRKALKQMGQRDLIGNGTKHLVPSRQPPKRHRVVKPGDGNFRTQHTGEHRGKGRRR